MFLKTHKKIYDGWEKIVNGFKNGILPLSIKNGTKTDILDTPEQKRFNDFLSQIKEEQRNIDMSLFKEVFGYGTPYKMLQTLHSLKRVDSYNQKALSMEDIIVRIGDKVKKMSESAEKIKGKKILKIVSKILDFNLNEQNQRGQGLKIITPNQVLSRLPISSSQLKEGNNSGKLKNEIKQLL